MDDIMQKIQSVLSDKESMEQLSQLAQMFSQPSQSQEQTAQESTAQQSASPDLSSLFSAMSQNAQSPPPPQNDAPGLDFSTVMALQSIMSKASAPDKNRDFLIALKPLLKEENRRKIDKLVTIFKLMAVLPLLKESGLLGGDLLGIL